MDHSHDHETIQRHDNIHGTRKLDGPSPFSALHIPKPGPTANVGLLIASALFLAGVRMWLNR